MSRARCTDRSEPPAQDWSMTARRNLAAVGPRSSEGQESTHLGRSPQLLRVPRSPTSARSTAPIASWAGFIRQPVFDRRLSLCTTETTIMISRADGGGDQGNPAGGRDHAPSRGRDRSGPVAGGGLWLTASPGGRCTGTPTGHFFRPRSGSTTVIAVEECGLLATTVLCGGVDLVKARESGKTSGRHPAMARIG
jgi:hypothetical protein